MQKIFRRSIWIAVWIATMGITGWLCLELASKHPVILTLVLLAAFVASVGPAYARQMWHNGAKASGSAVVWVSALAIAALIFSEISYWSSSIESIHVQINDQKSLEEGKRLVAQRQKEKFAAAEVTKTPEQIAAEIKAAEQHPRWASSAQCTNATAPESRQFCTDYYALKGQFAAASSSETIAERLWSAKIEDTNIKRDFYAAAKMLSENVGGSVQAWIGVIVVVMVLLLESLRDLSLFIAFAPEPRRVAVQARKDLERRPVAPAASAAPEAPVAVSEPKEEKPVPFVSPEPVKAAPPPAKPAVAEAISQVPKFPQLVVDNNDKDFPPNGRGGKRTKGKREGAVKKFFEDTTSQTDDPRVKPGSAEVRRSYVAWCEAEGLQPVKLKTMSRQLTVLLRRDSGKGRGPRDAKGSVYPGLVLTKPEQFQMRSRPSGQFQRRSA